jgi:hypothetical protein
MKKLISLLSLVVAFAATNSHAAIINVQPVVGGYYDLTFNPIPPTFPNLANPYIVQVDVYMNVVSLGPNEDSFGTAAFSFETEPIGGGYIKPSLDAGGWAANPLGNTDSNGAAPGGVVPVIATNADLGVKITKASWFRWLPVPSPMLPTNDATSVNQAVPSDTRYCLVPHFLKRGSDTPLH